MDIINYPNYLIYDDGKVWSKKSNKFLKPSPNSGGYLQLVLYTGDGIKHSNKIHKLIGKHYIPNPENKLCIDHINGNITDNRLENLRWVNRQENSQNKKKQSNNTTGYKGVSKDKRYNSYQAIIFNEGKQIYLGSFPTAEEASAVYEIKAREIFGEFYRPQ